MDRSSQNPKKFRLLEGGAEDRRTPEEELKARVRYQEALVGLGKSALSEANFRDLLDEAARVVAEVLSVEYCKIWNSRRTAPSSCCERAPGGRRDTSAA